MVQVDQTGNDGCLDKVDKANRRTKGNSCETEVWKSEGRIGSKKDSICSIHAQFEELTKYADVIQPMDKNRKFLLIYLNLLSIYYMSGTG